VVSNVEDTRAGLVARGVEVSEDREFPWGKFAFFRDPDGNRWSVQQIPSRA